MSSLLVSNSYAFNPCAPEHTPPAHYLQGDIIVPDIIVEVQDMRILHRLCNVDDNWEIYGCAIKYYEDWKVSRTEIYWLNMGNMEYNQCILRHELAHVNGWSTSHQQY